MKIADIEFQVIEEALGIIRTNQDDKETVFEQIRIIKKYVDIIKNYYS